MPGRAYHSLFEIAADQHGYFTAAQARESGIRPGTVVMMEQRRSVERVARGVYRLVHFPLAKNSLYMEATLWPAGIRGVISHESALVLHELSDVNPTKVHLTVPRAFRVRRDVPAYLALHSMDLRDGEVELVDGIPTTTPERTIRDCHAARLGPALIRQAIDDGRRSGALPSRTADALERDLLLTH
jgi:predicted transcriptional regulator of viral defense system